MAAFGWLGPLIDLSTAASHNGFYVQLLVFVHTCRPIQKHRGVNGGGEASSSWRTDLQVGDNTRSYFSVSCWDKTIASLVAPGHIILLNNVKIVKYGDVFGATTVQFSSMQQLIHQHELAALKGMDKLLGDCRVGRATKEKLKKVIEWLLQSRSTFHCLQQSHGKASVNWKLQEKIKSKECSSISELLHLTHCCNAIFNASVGEILQSSKWKPNGEHEEAKMVVSKMLPAMEDGKLVEEFLCTGCKLCGNPINAGCPMAFYCEKSSNYVHDVCMIYRPFLLNVWDQTDHILVLVKNKAAEVLFGNISAERVYACFLEQQEKDQIFDFESNAYGTASFNSEEAVATAFQSSCVNKSCQPSSVGLAKGIQDEKKLNFHHIWLILLKMLPCKGNSPLRFEISLNWGLGEEDGRFELVSLTMPCNRTNVASVKQL